MFGRATIRLGIGPHSIIITLHRHRSTEVNHTLHDVWPSPGLVHYIYFFRGSCPLTEFYHVQNSLSVQVLRSPILVALLHGTRAVGVSQALRRGIFTHRAAIPFDIGWSNCIVSVKFLAGIGKTVCTK